MPKGLFDFPGYTGPEGYGCHGVALRSVENWR